MNIILFRQQDIGENGHLILQDHRAEHIVKVLGSKVGDSVRVGLLNGCLGQGRILTLQKKFPFSAEIKFELLQQPPLPGPADLLLALPRPIMFKRILGQLAPLGVANLYVIHSRRVEKSFWDANLFEEDEYTPFLVHGLEQAVDTVPAKVQFFKRFKPFMEDSLPAIAAHYSHLLIAHPGQSLPLSVCLGKARQAGAGGAGRVLVAIGPEGGWIDYEMDFFTRMGFTQFSLGERILKVDTAVVNILGRIAALCEKE